MAVLGKWSTGALRRCFISITSALSHHMKRCPSIGKLLSFHHNDNEYDFIVDFVDRSLMFFCQYSLHCETISYHSLEDSPSSSLSLQYLSLSLSSVCVQQGRTFTFFGDYAVGC